MDVSTAVPGNRNLPTIFESNQETFYSSRGLNPQTQTHTPLLSCTPPSSSSASNPPVRDYQHILGTNLSAILPVNPRVTFCQFIGGLARSRLFRSALFAGAAVALTNAFALASATAAMGAGGTALAALVGTVAAATLVTLAANPLTYVVLLTVGVAALAITILAKKRGVRVLTAIVTIVAAAAFVTIATTPPAWVVLTAVGIAAFGVAIVCQLPKHGAQKLSLECSSLKRLFLSLRRKSFNEITIPGRDPNAAAKIYLGPIPSRLTRDLRHLNAQKGVTAVLAFNQPLEKINRFISHFPYNDATAHSEGVLARLDVAAIDHKPLSIDQLSAAADFIHQELDENQQSVYVHCLAGVGRSAMGIAAYLIKEHGMTVDQAITTIRASRPSSTINKPSKRGNLDAFAKICMLQRIGLDDRIPQGMSDQEARELMSAVEQVENSTSNNVRETIDLAIAQVVFNTPGSTIYTNSEIKRELLARYKQHLINNPQPK
jgi:protein-tyrosine phosphatase